MRSTFPSFPFSSLQASNTTLLPFLTKVFLGLERPPFFHDGGCGHSWLAMLEDLGRPEALGPALPSQHFLRQVPACDPGAWEERARHGP